MSQKSIVVGDGGGFIGGHLAGSLLSQGHQVRCSDIKPTENWYQVHGDAENMMADLSWIEHAQAACEGMNEVYQLTADMGGMSFIENNKALWMLTVLTSTHKLDAPKGVNGRNSNNTIIMDRLCWAPSIKLRDGMERTYRWIHDEYMAKYDKYPHFD